MLYLPTDCVYPMTCVTLHVVDSPTSTDTSWHLPQLAGKCQDVHLELVAKGCFIPCSQAASISAPNVTDVSGITIFFRLQLLWILILLKNWF